MKANWSHVALKEVCEGARTVDPTKAPDSSFRYVDVSSVSNQTYRIEESTELFGREAPSRARREIKTGDVIFATVRPTLMRVAQVPTDLDGQICSTGYIVLRPRECMDARYLYYSLFRPNFIEAMEGLQAGASYPAVTDRQVLEQSVPLPALEEQKRIVAALDQAFAALDRARTHAEANLGDSAALFSSWLSAAFAACKVEWPERAVADICENLDRLRVPITKADREPGTVPYYGASGVVDHVATHIFDEDLLLVSEDGANLLARTSPIAFSITGKAWVNNHAHVLRFGDLDTQEFVRLYLNSISLEPFVSGMAQPKLNQKALNGIPVPFPEIAEQRRIVAQAREVGEATDRARDRYAAQIADIAELRQSLLQQAFSGQLA